jgi:iron complex outermembrane recepter protein
MTMTYRSAWRLTACAIGLVGLSPAAPAASSDADIGPVDSKAVPEVVVVGTTPLPGSRVDLDKVPSNVQSLGPDGLDSDHHSDLVPTAAARRMASVSLNDEQGNPFQPDFVYRGFEASPISGIAEGLAVYQNGTRINEAFGDSVNWDLIPQFAVNRLTVQSNNPVFGLNALGGAVTLDMKNGFNSPGAELQVSHGNFANTTGYAAYGGRNGNFGFYVAAGGVKDGGFRYLSPTNLRQGYADIGYEDDRTTLHASVTIANNAIGELGPTPVEMLAVDPKSVFTSPQSTHDEMQLTQLNGTFKATDTLLVAGAVYYRHFTQHLLNGNTTNVGICGNNTGFFCLGGAGNYPDDALFDKTGNQVPASVLPFDATPGELDRTSTATSTVGGAFQGTFTGRLGGRENSLVFGASVDHSTTRYSASGELGTVLPSLEVVGSGTIIDQGQSATASPPIIEPVSVRPTTDYYGIYFTDTLTVNDKLAWSLSGRYNRAQIDIHDLLGTALNGNHSYGRFNPGTGVTYKLADNLTAYAGYSESNRAPTAGELSCADPQSPCLLDAFLVSDPELKQVVARTYEAGLRGHLTSPDKADSLRWYFSLYRTDSRNDIILLATAINGFGYFDNAGTTRRQGIETGIRFSSEHWDADISYAMVDATFREDLTLASNSPSADADGNIHVHSGNRIPLTPRSRVTAGFDYSPTRQWKIGADVRYTGSAYLSGDESNQEPQLPSYTVVNFHGSCQVSKSLQVFAGIDNAFDKTYYTFGAFAQLNGLPPNFNLSNPRTYSPSPPRTYFGGIRLSF